VVQSRQEEEPATHRAAVCLPAILLLLALPCLSAAAQEQAGNRGFQTIREIFQANCAACHDWAGSYEGITEPGRLVKGSPQASAVYTSVADDSMPPMDPKLTPAQKNLIRDWIAAGAPSGSEPIAQAPAPEPTKEGTTTPVKPKGLSGFSGRVRFHQVSGFTSGALLLAAGAVGAAQWGTLIAAGHEYREANGIEEDQISSVCAAYIRGLWSEPFHQTLRWTHVGLLSAGEAFYLYNAVTGVRMLTKDRPGLTPQDLHRYAFFTHGALMITELIMGIFTTEVLSSGNHWAMVGVGAAHSIIGVTIPLVVIGSGLAVNCMLKAR
jgi:mono/diheme cytochrome c family protein